MKKLMLVFSIFCYGYFLQGQQTAFPGAEGFGKYTTGGRGGIVIEVTNLSDNGTGSLRNALTSSSYINKKRTIIFRISGIIALQSTISIKNDSYITIAGQTAPGDGICIKNFPISVQSSHDIIIRYIRFRLGDEQNCGTGCDELDAHNYRDSYNIMLDHCSLSWSIDDILDLTVGTGFSTVQWCMLSEPLNNSKHSKGAHGYIGGWDGNSTANGTGFGGGTYHHNLLASAQSRTPRLDKYINNNRRDLIDVVNNVIYNWDGFGAYGGENADVNWENNYYKYGPGTASSIRYQIFKADDSCQMYLSGNYVDGSTNITDQNILGINLETSFLSRKNFIQDMPYPVLSINKEEAINAYESVLNHSGAFLPKRDICDQRIVSDVKNRTGKIINSQSDVGGWPVFIPQQRFDNYDTDKDGMPNFWEKQMGLDSTNADDRNNLLSNGYTALETYLNAREFILPVTGFKLNKVSDPYIHIVWTDCYLSEQGFVIERADNNGEFAVLAEVGANENSYIDSTTSDNNNYSYRIKAITTDWETSFSEVQHTSNMPPKVSYIYPEFETIVTNDTVTFQWNASTNGELYKLFVGNEPEFMTEIYAGTEISYTHITDSKKTEFYWKVDALNDSGSVQGDIQRFSKQLPSGLREQRIISSINIYPDPSFKDVTIEWFNPVYERVSIKIYDLQGRLVSQLTKSEFQPGINSIVWDGSTTYGKRVYAGIYLCRIYFQKSNIHMVYRINRLSN